MPFIVGGFGVRNKSTQAGTEELRLTKDQINNPTAAYMLACRAAMVKDFLVVAAGFFQGVGQERQAVKDAGVVDRVSQLANSAVAPGEQVQIDRGLPEKQGTNYIRNNSGLGAIFRVGGDSRVSS
jgi:hypothetical protein